jgi:hypothetical protein
MSDEARPWDIFDPNTVYLDKEKYKLRMEACNSCPELINFTKQCKKCGCFMTLKTKMAHASCPLGKWSSEIPLES